MFLNKENLIKVLKGAAIAAAGAGLTAIVEYATTQTVGLWPLIGAVASVLVNYLRKLKDQWGG